MHVTLSFLLIFISMGCYSQTFKPPFSPLYDALTEGKHPTTAASLKLKGNVVKIIEMDSIHREHFKYCVFNNQKQLIQMVDSSTREYEISNFEYHKNGNIAKITKTNVDYDTFVIVKLFNDSGFLYKQIFNNSKKVSTDYVMNIDYTGYPGIILRQYDWKTEKSSYDRPENDTASFEFDVKGNLSKEVVSNYYTYLIGYDSTLTYRKFENYKTNCYPSNSCIYFEKYVTVDENGNITRASGGDYTVRNSYWSYSFIYEATYNEYHLPVTELYCDERHKFSRGLPEPCVNQKDNTYNFDRYGNWVEKKTSENGKVLTLVKRQITYRKH